MTRERALAGLALGLVPVVVLVLVALVFAPPGPLGRFNPFFGRAGTLHRSFFHQEFANSFFSTGGGVRFHGSQLGNNPVPPLGLSPLLPTEALTIFGFDVLSRRQTITIVNITPGFKSPAISLAKVRQSSATVKFLPDW